MRAFTGARLHLGMPIPPLTLSDAACMTGSNVNYVQAAITVLRAEDAALVEAVRTGEIALLAAAAQVRRLLRVGRAKTMGHPALTIKQAE
jgi:hypothetical protein